MRWTPGPRFERVVSAILDTMEGRKRRRFALVPHLAERPDGSAVWIWLEWARVYNYHGTTGGGSVRCWEVIDEK